MLAAIKRQQAQGNRSISLIQFWIPEETKNTDRKSSFISGICDFYPKFTLKLVKDDKIISVSFMVNFGFKILQPAKIV